jgi:hypothetical protein
MQSRIKRQADHSVAGALGVGQRALWHAAIGVRGLEVERTRVMDSSFNPAIGKLAADFIAAIDIHHE